MRASVAGGCSWSIAWRRRPRRSIGLYDTATIALPPSGSSIQLFQSFQSFQGIAVVGNPVPRTGFQMRVNYQVPMKQYRKPSSRKRRK